ncbi:MAG: hypothetical protein QOI98_1725, partial [Solirubrobacteraceae bacterium]|nr:hypothetical protein [Solirubrobacteraceae bacterium]
MRRVLALAVALTACGALAAPAPALVSGRHVEVLQYAHMPGAGPKTKLRLGHHLQRLGLEVRAFEKLPMLVVF